jgi:uncharacterized protein YjbI with pentapeptide repeats
VPGHAPWPLPAAPPSPKAIAQRLVTFAQQQRSTLQRRIAKDTPGQGRADEKGVDSQALAADVQAAVTVLGRRELPPDGLRPLDLVQVDLRRMQLGGANLQGAQLDGANLQGARLGGANLQDAQLGGANLQDAQLGGVNLQGARLDGAKLGGAGLNAADLRGAVLAGADLRTARLDGADLFGAELDSVTLPGMHAAPNGCLAVCQRRPG